MSQSKIRTDRLLALVLIGVLTLNYPLLSLFRQTTLLFGIPTLYLYLFLVWGLFIFLTALIMERKAASTPTGEEHGPRPRN